MTFYSDNTELCMYIVFLAVWCIALCFAVSYASLYLRFRKVQQADSTNNALSSSANSVRPLSVVITAHNQANALRRNLPMFLEQDYDDYEVIVVNAASTDHTEEVLKELELRYPALHHTFVPQSARYISAKRLALTLGIRAARYENVVISEADCCPCSTQWLARLAQCLSQSEHKQIVVGYANYARPRNMVERKMVFYRLYHQMTTLAHGLHHAAHRAESGNWCYSKNLFLEGNGFAGHVNLLAGAEDLLVNRNSCALNTAILIHPQATIRKEYPSYKHLWKQEQVFYAETCRHLKHTTLYQLKYTLRLWLPWVMLIIYVATLFVGLQQHNYLSIGIASVLFFLYHLIKDLAFHRSARALGERSFHCLLPLYELALPFWKMEISLLHRFKSKREFRKKNY